MKIQKIKILAISLILLSPVIAKANDEENACGALLCLSTATRPSECAPYIARFFSISAKKFWDTIRLRNDFLNLCPVGIKQGMDEYKNAMALGTAICDPTYMNNKTYTPKITFGQIGQDNYGETTDSCFPELVINNMPRACLLYFGNETFTDNNLIDLQPVFVSSNVYGRDVGVWTTKKDYEKAKRVVASRTSQVINCKKTKRYENSR